MRNAVFFSVVILLSGCSTNHQHDGLYVANREVMGITKAWILEGDVVTVYSMGTTDVIRCKQFNDRIEIGDEVYVFNNDGDLVSEKGDKKAKGYRMVKMSERTRYNFGELDKIVSEAYERERKNRRSANP